MTWATVITLSFVGLSGVIGSIREGGREAAVRFLVNFWLLACAYAMWDRYL